MSERDRATLFVSVPIHHARIVAQYADIRVSVAGLGDYEIDVLRGIADRGVRILLDPDLHSLRRTAVYATGRSYRSVLGDEPEALAGYAERFDRYVAVLERIGDRVWGYLGIDQGSVSARAIAQAALEGAGFQPIPTAHALGGSRDLEYLAELADVHDRVALSGMDALSAGARQKVLARLWASTHGRRARVHISRASIDRLMLAYPFASYDTADPLRSYFDSSALPAGLRALDGPLVDSDTHGRRKLMRVLARIGRMHGRGLQAYMTEQY